MLFRSQEAERLFDGEWMSSPEYMQPRRERLRSMQADTDRNNRDFRARIREHDRANRKSIDEVVDNWDTARGATKLVRDGCTTTLMVGATVATAGGSAALIAAGSGTALRFAAKLQDAKGSWRDNLGAASTQAVGDLIFTIAPATRAGAVMRGVKGAKESAIVIVEAAWDAGVSLLEGKEVKEALIGGGLSLAVGAMPGVLDGRDILTKHRESLMRSIDRGVLPLTLRTVGRKEALRMSKTVMRAATNVGVDVGKGAVSGMAVGKSVSSRANPAAAKTSGIDNAAIVDGGLVARAIRRID